MNEYGTDLFWEIFTDVEECFLTRQTDSRIHLSTACHLQRHFEGEMNRKWTKGSAKKNMHVKVMMDGGTTKRWNGEFAV